jgi:FlgD Ig-like domain
VPTFAEAAVGSVVARRAAVQSGCAVARYAPAALVAALLAVTAVAFVTTERLKLTPSPIIGTRVDKVFSPVCDCDTDTATISFRLREREVVSVQIVDGGGNRVSELAREQPAARGRVTFFWDGRDNAGRVVPEGSYRPRVELQRERRTITLPNPIQVDVTPPRVRLLSARPRVFSPDGDKRADRVIVRFRSDERASGSLLVDGVQSVRLRGKTRAGRIDWFGTVAGEPVDAGVYALSVIARDAAGNLGGPTREVTIVARFVALGRDRIETTAGGSFAVLVSSDAGRVRWKLGARRGTAAPGTLRVRAPQRAGRYTLTVTANGHRDRAAVLVRPRPEPA